MEVPVLNYMFREDADRTLAPFYATEGAAAFDLSANLPAVFQDRMMIAAGEVVLVPTGLHVEIPPGWEMQVRSRSGMSLRGLVVRNQPGTIDSDYRDEVMVMLENRGSGDKVIDHGDRIAQAVIARAPQARLVETDALSRTARGNGGFGSTGTGRIAAPDPAPAAEAVRPAPDDPVVARILRLAVAAGDSLRVRHARRGTLYDVKVVLTPFLLPLEDDDRVNFGHAHDTGPGTHPCFDLLRQAAYQAVGGSSDAALDVGVQTDGGHHITWALYVPVEAQGSDLPAAWLRPVREFAGGRFEIVET